MNGRVSGLINYIYYYPRRDTDIIVFVREYLMLLKYTVIHLKDKILFPWDTSHITRME